MQGGTKAELNIGKLLMKRGSVIATSLRGRPAAGKGAIVAAVREHVWPMIADGRVRPIVHTTMPMSDAAAAHALFDAGGVIGKVLLTVPAYGGANGDGG
jgi:NADPH:quinone reductase-like Zn-dependent oxidoreductase